MNLHKLLSLILISTLFVGCSEKTSPSNESTVLRAYRLIDADRDDEAIYLLNQKLLKDPENYNLKVVLASAYAHKAGFKIQNIVPVFFEAKSLQKLQSKITRVNKTERNSKSKQSMNPNKKVKSESDSRVEKTSVVLHQLAETFDVFAAIPIVESNKVLYLRYAIDILNSLEGKIRPTEAIYRAVLNTLMLKVILANEFLTSDSQGSNTSQQCRINLASLNDSLVRAGKILIDILNDIGYGNPKHAPKMKEASYSVAQNVSDLTVFNTSLMVLNETSELFLQKSLLQSGFGKFIECVGPNGNAL